MTPSEYLRLLLDPIRRDIGEQALERKLHQTIIKVTDDMAEFRFNTAIAAMMELNNLLVRSKQTEVNGTAVWNEAVRSLVLMMAMPPVSSARYLRESV